MCLPFLSLFVRYDALLRGWCVVYGGDVRHLLLLNVLAESEDFKMITSSQLELSLCSIQMSDYMVVTHIFMYFFTRIVQSHFPQFTCALDSDVKYSSRHKQVV
jgi:hypothetical protein